MLTARRCRVTDDLGDMSDDFEPLHVFRKPKRENEGLELSTGFGRRLARYQAIAILEREGWSQQRIAAALGITTRHLRRRQGDLRAIAESQGRV